MIDSLGNRFDFTIFFQIGGEIRQIEVDPDDFSINRFDFTNLTSISSSQHWDAKTREIAIWTKQNKEK